MSDGAGPFLAALWGRIRPVRPSGAEGRPDTRNGRSGRYAARLRWAWDALPDLDRVSWKWPRRMG